MPKGIPKLGINKGWFKDNKKTLTCIVCGKLFDRFQKSKQKCCSYKCYRSIPKKKTRIELSCQNCKKIYSVVLSRKERSKYCSKECRNSVAGRIGGKSSIGVSRNKGNKRPDLSIYNKTHIRRGKNNPMWKGGLTPANKIIRGRLEFKLWKLSVFKRDNYTCKWCKKRGGNLNAHHILTFINNPKERLNIHNGITLCEKCHNKTKGKEKQFEQFFFNMLC